MRNENTKGRLLGLLAGLVLLAVAPGASAEINIPGLNFSPNPNDESLKMLGTFFGTADGIVRGSSPVMQAVMNIFNLAVLSLASIFAFYTIVSAVVQTAHDGEVLGKRYSSLWVPIRSAGGIAAIVPAGGFSAVQMLVLWIAAQGVGLANNLWEAGVDSLARNGGFVTPQVSLSQGGEEVVAQLVPIAACLQANAEAIAKEGNSYGITERSVSRDASTTSSEAPETGQRNFIDFGFDIPGAEFKRCGRITFQSGTTSTVQRAIFAAQAQALNNSINVLRAGIETMGSPQGQASVLRDAAQAYDRTVHAAAQAAVEAAAREANQKYAQEIEALKTKGWSAAGGSFMALGKLGQTVDSATDARSFSITPAKATVFEVGGADIESRMETLARNALRKVGGDTGSSGDGTTEKVNEFFGKPFKQMQARIAQMPVTIGTNPIIYWKGVGDTLLNVMGATLLALLAATAFAHSVKEGGGWAAKTADVFGVKDALSGAAVAVLSKIFLVFFFLMLGFVTVGVTLAVYIPMLPYIIWVSVLLSWLVAVAEAVIASPLWMMLHLNPEGDGIGSGGTEAGYKFIAATFLRPALSVIAFFVACSVLFAVGGFVNASVKEVYELTRAENSYSFGSLFAYLGFQFVAMGLAISLVSKSFNLCLTIPETILRWIGSSMTGSESLAGDTKNEFTGAVGVVTGAGKQGLSPRVRPSGGGEPAAEGVDPTKKVDGGGGGGGTTASGGTQRPTPGADVMAKDK